MANGNDFFTYEGWLQSSYYRTCEKEIVKAETSDAAATTFREYFKKWLESETIRFIFTVKMDIRDALRNEITGKKFIMVDNNGLGELDANSVFEQTYKNAEQTIERVELWIDQNIRNIEIEPLSGTGFQDKSEMNKTLDNINSKKHIRIISQGQKKVRRQLQLRK